ncbi:MAG TPA: Ig-like domain-containing protein [Planctomycetota bacterium]|nr:Ig-like domain-containing protein [Planctomycetota bacterium]
MRQIPLVPLLLAAVAAPCAHSATAVWDGGGVGVSWQTAANWVGDVAPVAGDALQFPAISTAPFRTSINTFPGGLAVAALSIANRGYDGVTGERVAVAGAVIGLAVGDTFGPPTNWRTPLFFGSGYHAWIVPGGIFVPEMTFSGAIQLSQDGALEPRIEKLDSGTLIWAGSDPNDIGGRVDIAQGMLRLSKSPGVEAIGSADHLIVVGDASGSLDASLDVQAANQIDDNAIIELRSDGSVRFQQDETIGTLRAAAGSTIQLDGNLRCAGTQYGSVVALIGGPGGLIVSGGTTLNLRVESSAILPWTGESLVSGGRLAIDDDASRARAINNGTIGGSGVIAGYCTVLDSAISPGSMPDQTSSERGTLAVVGDLSMNSRSRMLIQVLGGGSALADRVAVGGGGAGIDVNLGGNGVDANGAQLVVSAQAGYAAGPAMIIVDSPTPIAGRFAGLPEGAIFSVPVPPGGATAALRISYVGGSDTNDITLTDVTASGRAATTTAVVGAAPTSQLGQTVTFTATINESSLSVPSGSVYFLVDGVAISGPPATVLGNTVSQPIAGLGAGTHQVTAMYNGDASFLGSQGTVAHTVAGVTPPPPPGGGGGEDDGGGGGCGRGGAGAIAVAALMMALRAFGWRRRC